MAHREKKSDAEEVVVIYKQMYHDSTLPRDIREMQSVKNENSLKLIHRAILVQRFDNEYKLRTLFGLPQSAFLVITCQN